MINGPVMLGNGERLTDAVGHEMDREEDIRGDCAVSRLTNNLRFMTIYEGRRAEGNVSSGQGHLNKACGWLGSIHGNPI